MVYLLHRTVIVGYLRVLPIQPRSRPTGTVRLLLRRRRRVTLIGVPRLTIALGRRRVILIPRRFIGIPLTPILILRVAPVLERARRPEATPGARLS